MATSPQTSSESYKWMVLFTAVFGAFASVLDGTIVNTALPRIQTVFHADVHAASYVVTGYLLAAGIVVPASAFLAGRFGIKRIYLTSLAGFTLCSALCGVAPTLSFLIAFRIAQGAAGASLLPLSFALLFSVFPAEERGHANGIFGIPVTVAPTLGPTLGGYLTQFVDWRWVFYINVPIGVLGIILGLRILREQPTRANVPFDLRGFLLAASGLGLLLFGLSNLAYDGWKNVLEVRGPILLGLVLLGIFIPVALHTSQPLLDLRLFRRRTFLIGNLIVILMTLSLYGPNFLLPEYLQTVRGLTPFVAGLLLLWQGIGSITSTTVSGMVYSRLGPRLLILVGSGLVVVTGVFIARWVGDLAALSVLPWLLFFRGLGLPMANQSAGTVALDGITGIDLPVATTLNIALRNIVASLALAMLTTVLQQRIGLYTHTSASVLQASALGYKAVLMLTAVATAPIIGLVFLLPAGASGHDVLAELLPALSLPSARHGAAYAHIGNGGRTRIVTVRGRATASGYRPRERASITRRHMP